MDGYLIAFFAGCAVGGTGLFLAMMFDVGMTRVGSFLKRIF